MGSCSPAVAGLSGAMAAIVAMDTPRKEKGLVRDIETRQSGEGTENTTPWWWGTELSHPPNRYQPSICLTGTSISVLQAHIENLKPGGGGGGGCASAAHSYIPLACSASVFMQPPVCSHRLNTAYCNWAAAPLSSTWRASLPKLRPRHYETLSLRRKQKPIRVIEVNLERRRNEGAGKQDIPEKTRRPNASSATIPTCENPGAAPPGIELGLPSCMTSVSTEIRWEAWQTLSQSAPVSHTLYRLLTDLSLTCDSNPEPPVPQTRVLPIDHVHYPTPGSGARLDANMTSPAAESRSPSSPPSCPLATIQDRRLSLTRAGTRRGVGGAERRELVVDSGGRTRDKGPGQVSVGEDRTSGPDAEIGHGLRPAPPGGPLPLLHSRRVLRPQGAGDTLKKRRASQASRLRPCSGRAHYHTLRVVEPVIDDAIVCGWRSYTTHTITHQIQTTQDLTAYTTNPSFTRPANRLHWPTKCPDAVRQSASGTLLQQSSQQGTFRGHQVSEEGLLARVIAAADLGRPGIGDRVYQKMVLAEWMSGGFPSDRRRAAGEDQRKGRLRLQVASSRVGGWQAGLIAAQSHHSKAPQETCVEGVIFSGVAGRRKRHTRKRSSASWSLAARRTLRLSTLGEARKVEERRRLKRRDGLSQRRRDAVNLGGTRSGGACAVTGGICIAKYLRAKKLSTETPRKLCRYRDLLTRRAPSSCILRASGFDIPIRLTAVVPEAAIALERHCLVLTKSPSRSLTCLTSSAPNVLVVLADLINEGFLPTNSEHCEYLHPHKT
ncbi:hypothetical protein PR048_021248 [Dryococelus australis]|uniref:Uncharacterized protein n=1 Tax=Dryococelus australis TaxID=614101 RepID=A0ABQ9GXU2_9NEOP|nr:hypothetical protein PR048_021248 [Dryococelus australis]